MAAAKGRHVRRWRVAGSIIALAGATWPLVRAWDVVIHGHPAYPLTCAVVIILALLGLITGLRGRPAGRRPAGGRRVARGIGTGLAMAGSLIVAALLVWLTPFPAGAQALADVGGDFPLLDQGVTVRDTPTRLILEPANPQGAAIVFWPGARIDTRAYVPLLAPLAAAGHEVRIVKEPFGLALADPNAAAGDIAANPGTWVVAGHSLGGVTASGFALRNPDVAGLALWASYPAGNATKTQGAVLSLWGPNDQFTTPDQVEASAARLPGDTQFVEIPGANHSVFADIATMPGDGNVPDPDAARAAISGAMVTWVGQVG